MQVLEMQVKDISVKLASSEESVKAHDRVLADLNKTIEQLHNEKVRMHNIA